MTTPRKKVRAKPATQKLEAGVASVGRAVNALVKLVEREGVKLKAEDVAKAFSFISLAATVGQQKAMASVQAAGLTTFSLSGDLPRLTIPSLAVPTVGLAVPNGPVPQFALSAIGAVPAPGPSVEQLGGRFCKDVREKARAPGDDRGMSVTGEGDEPDFLDEDEDEDTTIGNSED